MTQIRGQNPSQLSVSNNAKLRLIGNVTDETICWVLGQSTANDGGQGLFYWDPLDTATDDNIDTIQPIGVDVGRWRRTRGTPLASDAETAAGVLVTKGVTPAGLASLALGTPPGLTAWQDQTAPVSIAITAATWTDRTFNTLSANSISGASMPDSTTFRLPSGSYITHATGICSKVDRHLTRLYNNSDAGVELYGSLEFALSTATLSASSSVMIGYFSIIGTKDVKLQSYVETTGTMGFDSSPIPAQYANSQIIFTQVA